MSTKADTRALVERLQAVGEDYEFYPTTPEMVQAVLDHIGTDAFAEMAGRTGWRRWDIKTVLDVGAGRGDFLRAAAEHEHTRGADLLAIERSKILVGHLVTFAKVIGADFHAQSFLPKQVDILFSNPPYKEYEAWASRLIKECPARAMYLVIPQRWRDSVAINDAIAFRKAQVEVVRSDDFLDADRRSRARVDILCVAPAEDHEEGNSLFTRFFMERFGHLRDKMEQSAEEDRKAEAERRSSLVKRDGLVGALVALYDAEMERMRTNYEKAATMDARLLAELGLSIKSIVDTLGAKIDGLKQKYWEELFTNLDTVTSRLTAKNQRALLDTIGGFKAVDFAADNVYAVLLWIIEHANRYVDSQVLDVFDTMLAKANLRNYKSNQRVYGEGRYRYMDEKPTHVSLDYRVVIESGCHGFRSTFSWESRRLSDTGRDFVNDLLCVATLLGFRPDGFQAEWVPGQPVLYRDVDGADIVEFKAFKNGNMHVRMSQKLSLALNVAVGKLRGWLRDSHDAAAEFGEAAKAAGEDIEQVFARETHITPRMLNLPGPRP